jgi:hypothetical protein
MHKVKTMEHYVRIIFEQDPGETFIRIFAGAMESTVSNHLMESQESVIFESYQTDKGQYVYEVELKKDLSNEVADAMVEKISKVVHGDYEIEVSGDGRLFTNL